MLSPFLSVVVPAYNRAHLLGRALKSIQEQSFRDFEVIVVDDGSTDDPAEVVAELNDNRFCVVRQANAGAAVARNYGARLASGEYLTFLDSDDEALTHWLESFHRVFQDEDADIVCCGLEKVGQGREVEERGGVLLPEDMGPMFDNIVARFTNGGSFAMRREIFVEVGGYDEGLASSQHSELAIRMIRLMRTNDLSIYNIMEPLIIIHVHGGMRIRSNPHALYEGTVYCLEKYKDLYERHPISYCHAHSIAGVSAARIGRIAEARRHFRLAVTKNPVSTKAWARLALSCMPALMKRKWSNLG